MEDIDVSLVKHVVLCIIAISNRHGYITKTVNRQFSSINAPPQSKLCFAAHGLSSAMNEMLNQSTIDY